MNHIENDFGRKGGRQRKPAGELRTKSYTAHANALQEHIIDKKCREAGMKPSEFTLAALLSAKVIARLPKQVMLWLREIAGMANNINQLARDANKYGYQSVHRRLTELAKDIEGLIKLIRSYPEYIEETEPKE